MSAAPLREFLDRLNHVAGPLRAPGASDARLLERWVTGHDEVPLAFGFPGT
jgi:hypothetical protein